MKKYKNSIIIMLVISFLQGLVFYSPVAALYRIEAGITLTQMGIIDAISLIFSIGLELPLGLVTAKLGYKKMLVLCNIIFFAAKLVFWKADSIGGFFAERILMSFVLAGLSGCDTAYLYLCAGSERSHKILSIWEAVAMCGMLCAGFTHSIFIGENYRLAGLLTAIAYGIAMMLTLLLKPMQMKHEDTVSIPLQLAALIAHYKANPQFSFYLISSAILMTVENTIVIFLSQLLYKRSGISVAFMGVLSVIVSVAGLIGAVSDKASHRLGAKRFTGALFLLASFCSVMLALRLPAVLTVAFIIAIRMAMSLYKPFYNYKQNEMAVGASRAVLLSGFSMQQSITMGLVSMGINAVADVSLSISLLCCGALLLLAYALNKLSQRKVQL